MQRLRGSDAQFLYNESPSSPYVTLKVMVYEPTDPNVVPNFHEMKAFIAAGVANWVTKGLGYRIVRVPFDVHHPVWIEDNNFCLDNHIHHIALPAPGSKESLCTFISYIMSMPLDPNRPLWDSWIVEGLEGGKIAWVCKMHHVLADGMMSAEHIINIHKQDPNNQDLAAKLASSEYIFKSSPDIPRKRDLVLSALKDLAKSYTLEFPTYYRDFKKARAANKALKEPTNVAYRAFMAPFTILNQPGGQYLRYRYETFSLREFKALSRNLNCTINDLVLALCSEALRRYMVEIEPLPNIPLVVVMPVSDRGNIAHQKFLNTEIQNNSVSVAFVPLDLSIENFVERLISIKQGSRAAMEEIRRTNGVRMDSFADFMPGSFFRILNWVFANRQKNKKKPLANIAISNVPGPREPLLACNDKLKMVELLSCGNLADITSLGITIWSYLDNLSFSCFFRESVMPNPKRFTQLLQETYQEILAEHGETAADSNSTNSGN